MSRSSAPPALSTAWRFCTRWITCCKGQKTTVTGLAFRFHKANSLCTEPTPIRKNSLLRFFLRGVGSVHRLQCRSHDDSQNNILFRTLSFSIMRQGIKSLKILGYDLQWENKRYKRSLSVETKPGPWLTLVGNDTKKVHNSTNWEVLIIIHNFRLSSVSHDWFSSSLFVCSLHPCRVNSFLSRLVEKQLLVVYGYF